MPVETHGDLSVIRALQVRDPGSKGPGTAANNLAMSRGAELLGPEAVLNAIGSSALLAGGSNATLPEDDDQSDGTRRPAGR